MRIIAVEEHVINPVIEKATRAAQAAEAGYLANLGARVGNKTPSSTDRP